MHLWLQSPPHARPSQRGGRAIPAPPQACVEDSSAQRQACAVLAALCSDAALAGAVVARGALESVVFHVIRPQREADHADLLAKRARCCRAGLPTLFCFVACQLQESAAPSAAPRCGFLWFNMWFICGLLIASAPVYVVSRLISYERPLLPKLCNILRAFTRSAGGWRRRWGGPDPARW